MSLISVNDLMLQTKGIATRQPSRLTGISSAAAIYLVITLLSQYILKRIDPERRRASNGDRADVITTRTAKGCIPN